MTSPIERVFGDRDEVGCARVAEIRDRLRAAGVRHVISFRPLDVEGLRLVAAAAPRRVAPLRLYLTAASTEPFRCGRSPRRSAPPGAGARRRLSPARQASRRRGRWPSREEPRDRRRRGGGRPVIEETTGSSSRSGRARPTVLVVRDGWGAGWSATVDGPRRPVLRADGRHRAAVSGAGRPEPGGPLLPAPSLTTALVIAAAGLALTLALLWRGRTSGRVA